MSAPTLPPPAELAPLPEPALAPEALPELVAAVAPAPPPARLVSLDAYRGFIMIAMASGGLAIPGVVKDIARTPEGRAWLGEHDWMHFLAFHTDHVAWAGCSFWDLIQPSFIFMVGVALPYSYASRLAKGDTLGKIYAHALFRSLLLVALGIFLSSNWGRQTNFIFVNVLTQIGLGYFFLYFLVGQGRLVQVAALAVLLGGYWLWFWASPPPGQDFDYLRVGLLGPESWDDGLFAHWNKNTNPAAHFDQWFLNLFPQPTKLSPHLAVQLGVFAPPPFGPLPSLPYLAHAPRLETGFVFNSGGYQTLNFVPSLATMIFGLLAGEMLRRRDINALMKFGHLAFAGVVCVVAGLVLGATVCPLVKRIWTPTWTIYSTGFTFLMLAGFYLVIDLLGFKKWAWPLVLVGMNSIAMYVMAQLLKPWTASTLRIHFGQEVFDGTYFGRQLFAPTFAPIAQAAAVLAVWWLICVWLYRQKIFIRI